MLRRVVGELKKLIFLGYYIFEKDIRPCNGLIQKLMDLKRDVNRQ